MFIKIRGDSNMRDLMVLWRNHCLRWPSLERMADPGKILRVHGHFGPWIWFASSIFCVPAPSPTTAISSQSGAFQNVKFQPFSSTMMKEWLSVDLLSRLRIESVLMIYIPFSVRVIDTKKSLKWFLSHKSSYILLYFQNFSYIPPI